VKVTATPSPPITWIGHGLGVAEGARVSVAWGTAAGCDDEQAIDRSNASAGTVAATSLKIEELRRAVLRGPRHSPESTKNPGACSTRVPGGLGSNRIEPKGPPCSAQSFASSSRQVS